MLKKHVRQLSALRRAPTTSETRYMMLSSTENHEMSPTDMPTHQPTCMPSRDHHEHGDSSRLTLDGTSLRGAPGDPSPVTGDSSTDLLHHSPHVKLPKLSPKKFNGDLTKWTTFWDTFESAVHKNPALTNIDKFSYLISLLESTAADAIAGLTLTSANYNSVHTTKIFGNFRILPVSCQ